MKIAAWLLSIALALVVAFLGASNQAGHAPKKPQRIAEFEQRMARLSADLKTEEDAYMSNPSNDEHLLKTRQLAKELQQARREMLAAMLP